MAPTLPSSSPIDSPLSGEELCMRSVYRILAYLVALEVVIQTALIAFAFFGLRRWIDDGGVLSAATIRNHTAAYTGAEGIMVHGINGQMIVPLIAVLLLIASFFAKVPGGVQWAAITLVTVVVQVLLGIFGSSVPVLGILHGVVAIALFVVAVIAGRRAQAGPIGSETPASRQAAGIA
jgi:hypothetical protein